MGDGVDTGSGPAPRILFVATRLEGHHLGGSAIRAGATLRGLELVGDVDTILLDDEGVRRPTGGRIAIASRSGGRRLPHWLAPLPEALTMRAGWLDRVAIGQWSAPALPRPDLCWFAKGSAYARLGHLADGIPTVVDLDDLEERTRPHRTRAAAAVDAWATGGLRSRIAAGADVVCLCSPEDRERAGLPRAEVLPNTAPAPRVDGITAVPATADLLFVGVLSYPPNRRGLTWLVEEVLPRLRERAPDVRVIAVGPGAEALPAAVRAQVETTGPVDSLDVHYARARCVVVPLHEGSGTRIKVIEALGHARPVVTTTRGVEGLPVEAGRTAMVADTAESFAGACERVIADDVLAQSLADAGRGLFDARFSPGLVEARVAEIARTALAADRHSDRGRLPR